MDPPGNWCEILMTLASAARAKREAAIATGAAAKPFKTVRLVIVMACSSNVGCCDCCCPARFDCARSALRLPGLSWLDGAPDSRGYSRLPRAGLQMALKTGIKSGDCERHGRCASTCALCPQMWRGSSRPAPKSRVRAAPSLALELGFLLGEEGSEADAVILGVEAGVAFVALGFGQRTWIGQAAREFLVPARHQRRARSDAPRRGHCFLLDFVVGDNPVDEAFLLRFGGIEHAAFEQDFERACASDQIDERGHFAVADHEAQLVDRDAGAAVCAEIGRASCRE